MLHEHIYANIKPYMSTVCSIRLPMQLSQNAEKGGARNLRNVGIFVHHSPYANMMLAYYLIC